MSNLIDQQYLLSKQYQNASNLEARMYLHNHFSLNKYPWQRWMFDQLVLGSEAKILEVGCGPAKLWLENQDRIPAGWQITLVDFSAGMLGQAQQNLSDVSHHFEFRQADAQALPLTDQSFDAVIANHMLYHVPDKAKALSEIYRVLKAGGLLWAATNGQGHMRELEELAYNFMQTQKKVTTGSGSFTLQNGQAQLDQVFPQVTLKPYENDLLVTEAKPLVAYVLSEPSVIDLLGQLKSEAEREVAIEKFTEFVEQEIATKGALRISKSTGLFEARKI